MSAPVPEKLDSSLHMKLAAIINRASYIRLEIARSQREYGFDRFSILQSLNGFEGELQEICNDAHEVMMVVEGRE